MHRKFEAVLLAALLVVGSVSGCGSKANENSNVTEEQTADEGGLPSGDVSLRVWGAEEDAELVNSVISSFISEHQGQANLKISFEAHSEASCKDELLSDVLNAPDVFTFADDQLMAFVASGVLKKVSNDSEISGRNLAAASDAASINGTLYAYPLTADNGYFLFYNQKVLSEEDVQTMDGLLAAASAAGGKFFMDMTSGWYMYSFFGNTDMEIGLNDDGISTYCNWNAKYTNITGKDVAEAIMAIGTNPAFAWSAPDGFVGGAADGTFVAGVSGVWDENSIKEVWGDDYAATKLPTYTVAGQQLQMSSYAGYKLVGVNSYSPNAAWAAEFADYMTNEKNQTLRFSMRGQGPSNKNASASGDVAQSKAILALQKQAEFSSLQRVGGTYWDAATTFATELVNGNPSGKDLQVLLNEMVYGITGEETTGDPEGVEPAEEATEETAEEVTEEASEEVTEESTEEVTEEVTEDNTEEVIEEVTDGNAKEVTEEVTKDKTTEAVEESDKEAVTEESTGEKTETVNEAKSEANPEGETAEDKKTEDTSQGESKNSNNSSEKKASDTFGKKIIEKIDSSEVGKSGENSKEKTNEDSNDETDKNSEESTEQTINPVPEAKSGDKNKGPAGINEKEEKTKEGTILSFEGLGKAATNLASIGG